MHQVNGTFVLFDTQLLSKVIDVIWLPKENFQKQSVPFLVPNQTLP